MSVCVGWQDLSKHVLPLLGHLLLALCETTGNAVLIGLTAEVSCVLLSKVQGRGTPRQEGIP